jgi:hypothetical protein
VGLSLSEFKIRDGKKERGAVGSAECNYEAYAIFMT